MPKVIFITRKTEKQGWHEFRATLKSRRDNNSVSEYNVHRENENSRFLLVTRILINIVCVQDEADVLHEL